MVQLLDVKRREIKYRISLATALRAQNFLKQVLPADPYNGIHGYMVRSLYFDSIYHDDLEDKLDGIEDRRKIRLRIYSPTDQTVKLELKSKNGEWQQKQSLRLSKSQALRLIACDYEVLKEVPHSLAEQLFVTMSREAYQPQVIVQYNRYAFMLDTNDIRVTFDQHLVATESSLDLFGEGLNFYPVGYSDDVTLEIKYNHFLLSYVRDLLDQIDKSSLSYSKYVMSRYISHQPE
ncbi:polyphosphate polymerase domain-containing protein [Enterococcus saccharolyticus]|uniref:VTC domain-containing protein n=1 Tax=Candidatus Enterococcus willemsii TaxID=1857215 RepID=A0ABQ6Z130_9ENTE|nr:MULTISPECIES: polyphosphate polymerase domain-containing protein [Enterococcus]KAF1305075.1 hypothetical protein BAU17_04680 [Enterococcus sp. CU12B]MCD5002551.1 polyphosphate polymerase domain-containing protein [Enterococcus saccharolyticus]